MNSLKITLVQADQIWENKQANLMNYEQLLSKTNDSDLIVLPEMFNTGFSMNATKLSENEHDCPSIEWAKDIAKRKNVAIYTSLIFQEPDKYYNRGIFVYPNGTIVNYDKIKTFGLAKEDDVFSKGTKQVCVKYRNWNILLQICYDLRFPEISLNRLKNNEPIYDVLIYIANWPSSRRQHWINLLPARAIENQCYVVAVNRVGVDAKHNTYSGDSTTLDMHGTSLINLGNKQNVKTISLDYNKLQQDRYKLPFLKDRDTIFYF